MIGQIRRFDGVQNSYGLPLGRFAAAHFGRFGVSTLLSYTQDVNVAMPKLWRAHTLYCILCLGMVMRRAS